MIHTNLPVHPNALEAVDYQSLVRRVQREMQISVPETRKLVNEYLSFLELKVIHKDWDATKLSPSAKIDAVWHLHVLDTKRYPEECKKLCNQMIHHNPDGAQDPERQQRYRRTLAAYREAFRLEPPAEIWRENLPVLQVSEPLPHRTRAYQLFIKGLDGKPYVIDLPGSEVTVRALKESIERKERIPIKDQILHYGGKQLMDHLPLKNYDITGESTIHLLLRLRAC